MLKLLGEALFLFFSVIDVEITKRKIAEYGIEVELNPTIKRLVNVLGVDWGTTVGIMVPTGCLGIAGWYQPHILSFILGVRTLLFVLQARTNYGN